MEKSSSYGDRHPHHSHQKDCLIKWKYASESIANLGWDYTSSTQMTTVLAWSWFDFVNNFCYCWLKTGSVGDGLTIFSTPCAVVSKNRLKFRRKRKRLRNGARWLPASLLLRNIVYNEFDFLLNSSVKCSSSDVFGLFSWFSMLQQNCRQSFIMLSNILDTEPMSKKDCEIKADKYSWWKPTSSVKSWESRIWACKTFHWDSITSTWI